MKHKGKQLVFYGYPPNFCLIETNVVVLLLMCRVEDELKRNLGAQKAENVKLSNQIGNLKAEKTQL